MKAPFRKHGHLLAAMDEPARELLAGLADGEQVMVSVTKARNTRQFRLFWTLIGILADNHDTYDTKQKAKLGLLTATGHVDMWFDHAGRMHLTPKSVAWENMKPEEFEEFFRAAVDRIAEWLGTAPEDIRKRAYDLIDGPQARARRA